MKELIENIKLKFKQGDMHVKLLMVNLGLFLATLLTSILIKFSFPAFNLAEYYAVSSSPFSLLVKPWTLITHMFTHDISGISHILWNMVMLYFIGDFFIRALGNRKMLSVYLAGGLAGYFLFALGYNLLPAFSSMEGMMVGASAAVTALMVCLVTYRPHLQMKFVFVQQPIKLVYIVAVFVLLDLIRLQSSLGVAGANAGGWMAHLGGAIFGFVYANQLKAGKDWLGGFEKFLDAVFSGTLFKKTPRKTKLKVKKGGKAKATTASQPKQETNINIEPILEKVKKSGYSSLTQKEKEIFFRQSNK